MASRGDDQFYFILTSDGSMEMYPNNKTSSFRVSLREPIDVGEEAWEVSLSSINYPYSWTNVGPSAKVFMKYYIDPLKGYHEINFPDWQCQSMGEVVKFLTKELDKKQKPDDKLRMWIGLDELGRFKISSSSSVFDVGFSENMLRLLGLAGHEQAKFMVISSFEKRQKARDMVNQFWQKDNPFDFSDQAITKAVHECKSLIDFITIMHPFIDMSRLEMLSFHFPFIFESDTYYIEGREKNGAFWTYFLSNSGTSEGDLTKTIGGQLLQFLMVKLKEIIVQPSLPKIIRGITPGMLNPVQRMFIYTNIMEPIDMNDDVVKLLKLVNTRGISFKTTQEDFTNPTYFPLLKGNHSMISILITDETGEPVSFQSGTVVITLHFRKVLHTRSTF